MKNISYDLSIFLLSGQFQQLKIGSNIQNIKMPFYNVTIEDGDIPSLYNLEDENESFQFTTLKNIVIGISYDFQYNTKISYNISIENLKFDLGYKTSFADLIAFLKLSNLDFEIDKPKEEDSTEIKLKKSDVLLSFSEYNLIKASVFDWNLCENIKNTQ